MFGKKKSVMIHVGDFQCGVCGTDCLDQHSFEQHVGWAHTGTATSTTGKKRELTGSEKKA